MVNKGKLKGTGGGLRVVSAAVMLTLLLHGCSASTSKAPWTPFDVEAESLHPVTAPADTEPEPAAAEPAATGGPPPVEIELTVEEAILQSLQNNRALAVERYRPAIRSTREEEILADFDPVLSGRVSANVRRLPSDGGFDTDESGTAIVTLNRDYPAGTGVGLEFSADPSADDQDSIRFGLTVTQALLNGRGADVNLAEVRQARIDTRISEYELRGFTESLVARVEEAYWNYDLAGRSVDIYERSLALARLALTETEERIKVGILPEVELAAAQAEAALRSEELINARSEMEIARINLLRLFNPPGGEPWSRRVRLLDFPLVPEGGLDDVEDHARLAIQSRPDLKEARLRLKRGDLELVRTRNGLLPRLDFFITLGKTGYSDSFLSTGGQLADESFDFEAGLIAQWPLSNRAALALDEQAFLGRRQAGDALENLEQTVQVDVRRAHIEASSLKEQISATAATRKLQEEKARAETEKFRVGRSTAFLLAQVQRDLVESQITEVEAVVSYLKALVDLYRLEGSLLDRRGIEAPGAFTSPAPVE